MDKKKQKNIVKIIFTVLIIITLIAIFYNPKIDITKDLASCIGENSILYSKEGCGACEVQEQKFGEYYYLLNSVDCKVDSVQCGLANIQYTPTWVIGGKLYTGVQEIRKLKQLTNC